MTTNAQFTRKPDYPVPMALAVGQFVEALCLTETPKCSSVFECVTPPPISVRDYAVRLGQYMRCSENAYVVAAILVQRLHDAAPEVFAQYAVLKIFSVASVIAAKFLHDDFFTNSYYAECAGVSLEELNQMESAFLNYIRFSVFVSEDLFERAKFALSSIDKMAGAHVCMTSLLNFRPTHVASV